jgi:hypothetical protein
MSSRNARCKTKILAQFSFALPEHVTVLVAALLQRVASGDPMTPQRDQHEGERYYAQQQQE